MPMGPWRDFDACLSDPGMLKRYPTEEQRRKVCGAIKVRLEAHDPTGPSRHTHGDLAGGSKITETPDYWIVHDAVCAREGVNDKAELKPWDELQASADSLEGAPIHYGTHPVDPATGKPSVRATFYDPRQRAVGHAINARAQQSDHTLRYDALLFKEKPVGYDTPTEDIAKNHATVELVRKGGSVENSGGYIIDATRSRGAGLFKQDGAPIAYHEVQRGIVWGHVALLKPVGSSLGGSCGPACAVGVDEAKTPQASAGDMDGDGDYDGDLYAEGDEVIKAKKRNSLQDSDFGCPEDRSFPIHNRAHAANALSRLGQQHNSKCSDASIKERIYHKYPDLKPTGGDQAHTCGEGTGCCKKRAATAALAIRSMAGGTARAALLNTAAGGDGIEATAAAAAGRAMRRIKS